MSSHDYVIANDTGANVRADLNLALLAIQSQNSGSSEPSTTYAYQWWADTNTGLLKQRNAANNAWISILTMSTGAVTTATTELSGDSSPALGGFLDCAGNYIQMQIGGAIASASPTVIDTDGDYFSCTGTTGFSAFTVAADRHFFLEFAGALTMTHGAGTLDLPGGANITTAASDVGEFVSTAANVVTCVNYTKATGKAVVESVGLATDQSWSGSQRGTPSTVTDGTLDLNTANNFQYTPATDPDTLEFGNETAGQSGFIKVINASGKTIALGSEVKKGTSWDVSTAGTYLVSYYCDGTDVYVSASEALS